MESHHGFDLHFLNGPDIMLIQTGPWVYKQLDLNSNLMLTWFGRDIFDVLESVFPALWNWGWVTLSEDIHWENVVASNRCFPSSSQSSLISIPHHNETVGQNAMYTQSANFATMSEEDHNFKKKGKGMEMIDCPRTKKKGFLCQNKEIRALLPPRPYHKEKWRMRSDLIAIFSIRGLLWGRWWPAVPSSMKDFTRKGQRNCGKLPGAWLLGTAPLLSGSWNIAMGIHQISCPQSPFQMW